MATTCGICVFGNDQTPLAGNVRRLRTTRAWKERHPSKPRFALPWHSRRHWIVRLVKPEIIQKCRTLAAGAGIPPWADILATSCSQLKPPTIRTTSTRRQQRQSMNCLWRLPNFRWLSANRLSKLRPSTNPSTYVLGSENWFKFHQKFFFTKKCISPKNDARLPAVSNGKAEHIAHTRKL